MEIDRISLQTMLREFWSVNNNDICEHATFMFLRKIGLSDEEIENWTNIDVKSIDKEEAERIFYDAIKETKDYYSNDED